MGLKDLIYRMKMSTGMANCAEYKELIELVIDNEASRDQDVFLKRHLKMCLKCLNKFDVDVELKKALKLKLQNKTVPAGLAESIRDKITRSA